MKITLLACLMLMSSFASAFEGAGSSGGGDPLIIMSTPYPETKQLEEAIELSLRKTQVAQIPASLKSELEKEILELKNQNKFQLLPAIIILGANGGPESYSLPDDAYKFISLGGMTRFVKSAPIFLSERVREYSSEKLADLVLHETLHHVLTPALTKDERFVEELSQGILRTNVPEKLRKALEIGAYFRKEYISREGFFNHPAINQILLKQVPGYDPGISVDHWLYLERMKSVQSYFRENMNEASLYSVYWAIINTLHGPSAFQMSVRNALIRMIQEINPGARPYLEGKKGYFGCKVKINFWSGECPQGQHILMNEVLLIK